jgi:hypothetical protein
VVGQLLNASTALTTIVSTRIYNGLRPGLAPPATGLSCINYFELSGGQNIYGFQRVGYSINCRAVTAETALQMAKIVDEIFNGSSGTGIYGYASSGSGFEISRAFTQRRQGLIPEPDEGLYNAPVDVFIVFPNSSIS